MDIYINSRCKAFLLSTVGDIEEEEFESKEVQLEFSQGFSGDYLSFNSSPDGDGYHTFGINEGEYAGSTLQIPSICCRFNGSFVDILSHQSHSGKDYSFIENIYELTYGSIKVEIKYYAPVDQNSYARLYIWGDSGWRLFLDRGRKDMICVKKKNRNYIYLDEDREDLIEIANKFLSGARK